MSFLHSVNAVNVIEWLGVASSLLGSILNARGQRCSFVFWTISALLLGVVALHLGRVGWLTLQGAGVGINVYGMRNWQGNAPTRQFARESC